MSDAGSQPQVPQGKPQRGCFGCLGSVASAVVVAVFGYVIAAPLTFYLGGRWTPLGRWEGVGRLRDSAGVQYGLYVRFGPYVNIEFRNDSTSPCCELSGKGRICTAAGANYSFDLAGHISGAWLHTDGSKVTFTLTEAGHPKLPRLFRLSGVWRGPNLVLDDQKSMFVNFLPGGNLMPNPISTAPVPDKHATVTLSWGSLSDFESVCASLGSPARDPHR